MFCSAASLVGYFLRNNSLHKKNYRGYLYLIFLRLTSNLLFRTTLTLYQQHVSLTDSQNNTLNSKTVFSDRIRQYTVITKIT